jgi:hypothetical protein
MKDSFWDTDLRNGDLLAGGNPLTETVKLAPVKGRWTETEWTRRRRTKTEADGDERTEADGGGGDGDDGDDGDRGGRRHGFNTEQRW